MASSLQNLHNSVCYYIVASSYKLCTLINYVQKKPNLLPIKGDACPLLRLGVAFGTYDLGATLLCYGKFEHSLAMYSKKREYSGIVPRPRDRLLPIRGIRPTYGIRCSVPEVRLARVPSFDCFAAASYLAFLVAICASIMLPATTPKLQGLAQRRQCMRGWYIPGRYHRRELSPTLP